MRDRAWRWNVWVLLLLMCGLRVDNTSAQGVAAAGAGDAKLSSGPTVDKIIARMLEKNRERHDALDRYTSDRIYEVRYTGTGGEHHAELHVHAEYEGPDRKTLTVVSQSGAKFLCEKVLHKLVDSEMEATGKNNRQQTTLSLENYDAVLLGEETVETPDGGPGIRAWILRVTPKVDNKFTYRGKVWISEDDYAVMRIVGEPAKNPSWWINRASFDSRYVRRGQIWLPGKNVSSSHVRIGGEATMTIDYGSYPVVAAHSVLPVTQSAAR